MPVRTRHGLKIVALLVASVLGQGLLHHDPSVVAAASSPSCSWYVATDGNGANDGSLSRPWDLGSALRQNKIKPGNTLCLREGIYGSGGPTLFISQLKGTATAPIIVRAYPGERVTIDGGITEYDAAADHENPCCGPYYAQYVWYWGFEITNTSPDRISMSGTDTSSSARPGGLQLYGDGSKAINLVINNTGHPGIGMWVPANTPGQGSGQEVYGTILYGTRLVDATGTVKSGSAIYAQSRVGGKSIRDNISFRNFTTGMKAYGQVTNNLLFEGNIFFDNGMVNLFTTANGEETKGLKVVHNFSYAKRDSTPGVHLGSYSPPSRPYDPGLDVEVRDNYIVGSYFSHFPDAQGRYPSPALTLENWRDSVTVTGNTFVGGFIQYHRLTNSQTTWNNNTYFLPSTARFALYQDGVFGNVAADGSFDDWQASCHCDVDSIFNRGYPTRNVVFTRPNQYEPGRANIIVYNWENAPSVSVDVSQVLNVGDAYEVRDAQDFYGTPLLRGVYTGLSLDLPMNLGLVATVTGDPRDAPFSNSHTAPEFGVFVLVKTPDIPLYLQVEAESGSLASGMAIGTDPGAIGSQYVSSDTLFTGSATYTFEVMHPGNYVIWCRVLSPTGSLDSFFVSVDGGQEDIYDTAEGSWSSSWQWTRVNGRENADVPLAENPRVFSLNVGPHTVTFRGREPNTALDQFVITNDFRVGSSLW